VAASFNGRKGANPKRIETGARPEQKRIEKREPQSKEANGEERRKKRYKPKKKRDGRATGTEAN
jgi:hypothetical protein